MRRAPELSVATSWRRRSRNRTPITDASCSVTLALVPTRSMRASISSATELGMSTVSGSPVRRHVPSPTSATMSSSMSASAISSANSGLPSARCANRACCGRLSAPGSSPSIRSAVAAADRGWRRMVCSSGSPSTAASNSAGALRAASTHSTGTSVVSRDRYRASSSEPRSAESTSSSTTSNGCAAAASRSTRATVSSKSGGRVWLPPSTPEITSLSGLSGRSAMWGPNASVISPSGSSPTTRADARITR